jgi:hypothetical protein
MATALFDTVEKFGDTFGCWWKSVPDARLEAIGFVPIPTGPTGQGPPAFEHAEIHLLGVLAADFTYAATVTFGAGGEAHMQFRISGDGCYGVRLSETGSVVYRQLFTTATGPSSKADANGWIWEPLAYGDGPLAANRPHAVWVTCLGAVFSVTVNGTSHDVAIAADDVARDEWLAVGRLGLYAFRPYNSRAAISFSGIAAMFDETARSNFSLLYSVGGYSLGGTKRALVRTLNGFDASVVAADSAFTLETTDGRPVHTGPLTAAPTTYGFQCWQADFSDVRVAGVYVLRCMIITSGGAIALESSPFAVDERTLSRRLLRPLTVLNAAARNAGDQGLDKASPPRRPHWEAVSGNFTIDDEGALVASNASDGPGYLLLRTADGYGGPSPDVAKQIGGYTMTGEVSISEGCDAQLQFGITPTRRLAVTLQAGEGGGCTHGDGPGAIRLHEEGIDVPGGFRILDARYLPKPFQPSVWYAIRITVTAASVAVFLNGDPLFTTPTQVDVLGGFAVKAWASSARFRYVAVWDPQVGFDWLALPGGESVDRPSVGKPCDGMVLAEKPSLNEQPLCMPIFAQRCGFDDCNNIIGESNSHGAFVAGVAEIWSRRKDELAPSDRDALARALRTGVAYLDRLFKLAGGEGRYKHEDLGRSGAGDYVDTDGHIAFYLTLSGVYGDASFAAKAFDVDESLAWAAMRRAWKGCRYLEQNNALESTHKALLYRLLAECARRDGGFAAEVAKDLGIAAAMAADQLDASAIDAANAFLNGAPPSDAPTPEGFAGWQGWQLATRDTGQMIPWLEGVHAIWRHDPNFAAAWEQRLSTLANDLLTYLLGHNAFQVIPQSSGGVLQTNTDNWDNMSVVPEVGPPVAGVGRSWYNCTFFATMALDMILLGEMTGDRRLEQLAVGHLNWVLGLNPGVPVTKTLNDSPSGPAWRAAAFVQGLDAPFARGFEDVDRGANHQKDPWPGWGEDTGGGQHRQAWWFHPPDNGFMSIINGHVVWDGQWDYYNTGLQGWISGETFLLNDGIYARALVSYEDWVAGAPQSWTDLGGDFTSVGAALNQDGRLEIVAARDTGTLADTWEEAPGGDIAAWTVMDGYVTEPFGMLNADGRMELFGRGADGQLMHRWQNSPNGPFAPWDALGGNVSEAIVGKNADGRMEIFATFADGSVHHRWQVAPNSYFADWQPMDASGRRPRIGTNADGRLELFLIGSDGQLIHRWQTAPNAYFSNWSSMGNNVTDMTVARNADGRMEIFAIASDNQVIHSWQTAPNAYFSDWFPMGGTVTSIASAVLGDGRIELFTIATDGGVWRNVQSVVNGPFIGWESLGSSARTLFATTERDGRAIILAVQNGGHLWLKRQPRIGSWLAD